MPIPQTSDFFSDETAAEHHLHGHGEDDGGQQHHEVEVVTFSSDSATSTQRGLTPSYASDDLNFSKLIVDVVQAYGLASLPGQKQNPSPFAVISFQDFSGATQPVSSNSHPYWNTNFCFDIDRETMTAVQEGKLAPESENGRVTVTIFSRVGTDSEHDEFLGETVIPLSALSDQVRHTEWYPLSGQLSDGRPAAGQIQLALLCLYDMPLLFEQLASQGEQKAEAVLAQIQLSKLVVDIVEVIDLPTGWTSTYPSLAIKLTFQGMSAVTGEGKLTSSQSLTWNINFTFDVIPDEEDTMLLLELIPEADQDNPNAVLGTCELSLSSFADQRRHRSVFALHEPQSGKPAGLLQLHLLWLHDLRSLMTRYRARTADPLSLAR